MGFLDLIDQAFKILPKRFGGTGNDSGHAEGLVVPFTAKSSIPLYSPVYVYQEYNRVTTTSTQDDVRVVGVVVGKYAQLAGEPEFSFVRSAPSNAELAAIMHVGRTPVRVFGNVNRDDYAYQSTSAGLAKGSNSIAAGAFGRFLASGSNTVSAYVFPTNLASSAGSLYLFSRLSAGSNITLTQLNAGPYEGVRISASVGSNLMSFPNPMTQRGDIIYGLASGNVSSNLIRPGDGSASFTAVSQFDASHGPEVAADGDAGTDWAASGVPNPAWWRVTWTFPRMLNRDVIRDRANGTDHYGTSGTLLFSDGTSVAYTGLDNAGAPLTVNFATKQGISWFEVRTTTGSGLNIGLSEVEAYYVAADGDPDRRSAGTEGQYLRMASGVPQWQAGSGGGAGVRFLDGAKWFD